MNKNGNFKVDPKLAELLGETYKSTEDAIKELIDNAFDADADQIWATLPEIFSEDAIITIVDDGTGMKEQELRGEYLKIASSRFARKGEKTHQKNRVVKGRKGIGKFSGLMVAEIMEVKTKAGGKETTLTIIKSELAKEKYDLEKVNLPIIVKDCGKEEHGTTITLKGINQNFNYPNPDKLKQILVWDYGRVSDLSIFVNTEKIGVQDYQGKTIEKEIELENGKTAKIIYTISDKPVKQSGLIYRVGNKIVGRPENFLKDDEIIPDKLKKRVVGEIICDDLEDFVTADWGSLIEGNKINEIIKEEQRRLCEIPKDENYNPDDICYQPNVEYPDLPEFVFDYSQEPNIKSLQEQLSEDSFTVLSNLVDFKKVKSFSELKLKLGTTLKNVHQKIVEKTQISEQVLAFGDTAIALKGNTIQLNDFTFQICTTWLANGYVSPYMVVQLPNSSYTVQQFIYHLHYDNGGNNTNGYFNQSLNGNVLTLSNMYNNTLPLSVNENVQGISGYIVFTNGQTYTFEVEGFSLQPICFRGKLVIKGGTDTGGNNNTDDNSFIPNTFGYRQLGIADYKKVVSKICKYEVGEVAHIENVMARELREKSTTKFHQTQVIETESTEIETEKINDTTSTERFEMQTEVAKLMQEQKQFAAHVDVRSSWGNTTIDAGASYASNVSKEESNRQAVNQAKEITQRAMERIVSRVKNEKTVKTTDEFTEENTHVFDNTESGEHVSGVFRFINAIYKNQIYNYGKRLMYEFMIPQPSKLHRLAMEVSKSNVSAVKIDKPIDPRTIGYADFTSINEYNYQQLASKYNAEVELVPDEYKIIGKSFSYTSQTTNTANTSVGSIPIEDDYFSNRIQIELGGAAPGGYTGWGKNIWILAGNVKKITGEASNLSFPMEVVKPYYKELPVTIGITNFHTVNVTITIECKLTNNAKEKWRKETFEAILKGYYNQLAAYNQSIAEAKASGIQILDSNPLFYRQIEQNVLRQNCISYLLDHSTNPNNYKKFGLPMYDTNASFTNFKINLDKKMDDYGSFAKFMEQAFEWNLISYNFYPYYWANKDEWKDLYQFESNDAIFRSFMQAGMARVIVTVKPGFEDAVMHYLTTGQIWLGGQMPVLGNPLYLSIVDELKEQEYTVEETWTTTLPTNLIALQKSGVSVDATGLPTLDTCETQTTKKLVANDAKLGIGTVESDTKLADRVAKIESRMIENIDINDGKISLTTKGKNRQVVAQISTEDLKRELQ